MPSYKEPSFQERTALANKAKQDAVERLRAKPPVAEATLAAQREAAELREVKLAKARDEKIAARKLEKAAKADRAVQAAAELKSPEEQKAARDAKYAARKGRKR